MNDFSYSFDVQDNFITIIIIFIFALVMFSNTKIFIRLMPTHFKMRIVLLPLCGNIEKISCQQ